MFVATPTHIVDVVLTCFNPLLVLQRALADYIRQLPRPFSVMFEGQRSDNDWAALQVKTKQTMKAFNNEDNKIVCATISPEEEESHREMLKTLKNNIW